jgi:hypothetical protein
VPGTVYMYCRCPVMKVDWLADGGITNISPENRFRKLAPVFVSFYTYITDLIQLYTVHLPVLQYKDRYGNVLIINLSCFHSIVPVYSWFPTPLGLWDCELG